MNPRNLWTAVLVSILGLFLLSPPGQAQNGAENAMQSCINGLIFKEKNWSNPTERTDFPRENAEEACKVVTTNSQALELKNCINDLMYDGTWSDPYNAKTGITPQEAVEDCKDVVPQVINKEEDTLRRTIKQLKSENERLKIENKRLQDALLKAK